VGSGNIDVGNANPTRNSGQTMVDTLSGSDDSGSRINPSLKTDRQGIVQGKTSAHPASLCGAMSQQGSEFRGNVSAPQKFVRLVGCRDRGAGPGREIHQYSNPVKR
jgi:hypothetical protein